MSINQVKKDALSAPITKGVVKMKLNLIVQLRYCSEEREILEKF